LTHAIRANVRNYGSPLREIALSYGVGQKAKPEDPRAAAERLNGRTLLRLAAGKIARKVLWPFARKPDG
jgi:hypothetical protein